MLFLQNVGMEWKHKFLFHFFKEQNNFISCLVIMALLKKSHLLTTCCHLKIFIETLKISQSTLSYCHNISCIEWNHCHFEDLLYYINVSGEYDLSHVYPGTQYITTLVVIHVLPIIQINWNFLTKHFYLYIQVKAEV